MKKNPLKIVQVIASKGWGGREKVPLLFGEEYRRLGHQPIFWVDPETSLGREAKRLRFQVEPYRFRSYLNPSGVLSLRRALLKDQPDVIHAHHSRDLWALVPALRISGWKGPLLLSKHVESGIRKKDPFHRFLFDRVDLVLACSTMIQKNVVETCPIDRGRVSVGFAPVDTDRFRFSAPGRKKIRKTWRAEKDTVVGMVSRLSPGKGHELILRTAALLVKKNARLRFKVAGQASADEMEYAKGLARLRDELGLQGKFDYEGYVADVPAFLSALDLAVHAAPAESFGLAIVEAMACGLPVVARRGGGVGDILRSVKGKVQGGSLMERDDPREWASEISRITRSRSLLDKARQESRQSASRFSLKELTQLNLDWYRELLFQKSGIPVTKGLP